MKLRVVLALVASLLAALLAVSHDSIWIDEAYSAHFAVQPDIGAWWRSLKAAGPPDIQMPLYMFFLWVWEKLCGSTEWALRAANILWFLVAQAAFWFGLRARPRLQFAALLCGACNPFLWRYLDEARPYAMQYSGATVVLGCLAWLAVSSEPVLGAAWIFAFGGGLFVLCGSNALGVPWAGAAMLALLCLGWRRARIAWSPASALACAMWSVALASLAAYYAWTLTIGIFGNSGYGHRLGGLCFSAYELLGFVGLGPSRILVTGEHDPRVFFPYIGILALAGVLFAGVLAIAARALVRRPDFRRLAAAAVCYPILPLCFLMALVLLKGWQPAARHFTPASPVVVLAVALALAAAWGEKSKWLIGWTTAFTLLWLVSSLEVRFAPRHRRDDYRDAAQAGREALAGGKRVWWVAAKYAGEYYGLSQTSDPKDVSRALLVYRPDSQYLANLPNPDVVILTKPVLFDTTGAIIAYLQARHYRQTETLQAFSIWEK
jgi:hypothetical protein